MKRPLSKKEAEIMRLAYTLDDTLREIQYTLDNTTGNQERVRKLNDILRRHFYQSTRRYSDDEFKIKVYEPLSDIYGEVGIISWNNLIAIPT